jgi:aryl-alcohol dehydrogenase-like predicted oxidoreductase
LLESIERSLRRLRTDCLDLIQLHSCSESVLRKGDAITALQSAREKGYSRYIGYSGDSLAAKFAVESGAFDTLQTSINIADQESLELILPLARERGMGVIAKRPIANAAWKEEHKPIDSYHHVYWDRLSKLDYDFIRQRSLEQSIAHALRFTLSVPGVHTAIVGTAKPERWLQNAKMIEAGLLKESEFEAIRERWDDIRSRTWIGQT